MNLHFAGKNIVVTPALKEFTSEKFKALEKRDHTITNINVVFHIENLTHMVEADVHVNGADIHATAKEDDMYKAVTTLANKLLAQIIKRRKKLTGHHGSRIKQPND